MWSFASTSRAGIVGWGEAQVIGTWGGDHGACYGETPRMTATAISEVLISAIAGHNVTEIEQLHACMDCGVRERRLSASRTRASTRSSDG